MSDLSSIKPREFSLDIKHPGDLETDVGLRVIMEPQSSPRAKAAQVKYARFIGANQGSAKVTDDELILEAMKPIAAQVTALDWDEDASWNGEKPEATTENLLAMFVEADWFYLQVRKGAEDTRNFFDI